jgi:hypothetical protein
MNLSKSFSFSNLYFLLLLCVIEVGLLTFLNQVFTWYIGSILFFAVGIAIGLSPLYTKDLDRHKEFNISKIWVWGIFSIISASLLFLFYETVIKHHPIDVTKSDIIPALKVYVTRFLEGTDVYAMINDFGYSMYPTYLPFTWGPYIIPELVEIDYRWAAQVVFFIATGFYIKNLLNKRVSTTYFWSAFILPFFVYWSLLSFATFSMAFTIEVMILGYFMFLANAIQRNLTWHLIIALILVLLSRYTIILWLPLYFLFYLLKDFKKGFLIGLFLLLGLSLFYIIPYLSQNWELFVTGVGKYTDVAVNEWSGQSWQSPGSKPYHLYRGLGFACFFNEWWPGSLIQKIEAYKLFQFLCTLGSLVLLGIIYQFKWKHRISLETFFLISLKIILTVFYSFVLVPYLYMFFPLLGVSMYLLLNGIKDSYR